MRMDLHLHSHYSDGSLAPPAVLAEIRRRRLAHWALTDHDSLRASRELAGEPGWISGVEVTSRHAGREIHLIGLGVAIDDPDLEDFLAGIRACRHERLACLTRHAADFFSCTLEEVVPAPSESPSRLHLARALQAAGAVSHASHAFQVCLSDARLGTLALPPFPRLDEAAAAIHAAGGVVILAHPGIYPSLDLIEQLLVEAPCDGLEVHHPALHPLLRRGLEALADRRGLLRSCGSDFHGLGPRQIGDWRLSRAAMAPLLARLGLPSGKCAPD